MSEQVTQEEKMDVHVSQKSRGLAMLLCFFFGWAGAHRYYAGRVGTGLMMFFTMGGFGLWWFIDFIMIAMGKFRDKDDLPLIDWKLS